MPTAAPNTATESSAVSSPSVATADPTGDWDIRWDRGFAGWKPAIFSGRLSIHHEGQSWTASLHFRESVMSPEFASMQVDGDKIHIVFHVPANEDGSGQADLEFSGWIRADRLVGEIRSGGNVPWTPCGGRRASGTTSDTTSPELKDGAVDHSLPKGDLATSGVDLAALQTLVEHGTAEHSSAIVIAKDGKVVVEKYRDGYDGSALAAMSASKSIVSIAVGMLVADGRVSLDTRVGSILPELKTDAAKARITVRQLLTHTSGLEPSRANWNGETIREHALNAKLVFEPGSNFQYNNGAVDFLGVVFKQAAGVGMDTYLDSRLFQKLDMVGASWMKDTEGTPRGAGELLIRPVDLAKVGELMLGGGLWSGQRLLTKEWVKRSVEAGQTYEEDCGLLWWREGTFAFVLTDQVLAAWRGLGFDTAARSARGLLGKTFTSYADYSAAVRDAIGASEATKLMGVITSKDHVPFVARVKVGPVTGFSARGWLGQFLVVLPEQHVVAVRMRAAEGGDYQGDGGEENGYRGFASDVAKLFPAAAAPSGAPKG
jgi:CubicO group peptidase (beta-lactamase class C family)